MAALTTALAGCSNPDRFDLACTGSTSVVSGAKEHQTTRTQAWADRYIVDVRMKTWCRLRDCAVLSDFSEVTPNTLTFYDMTSGLPPKFTEQAYVRRTTGEFVADVTPILPDAPEDGGHTSGTCARARFSGFPRARF